MCDRHIPGLHPTHSNPLPKTPDPTMIDIPLEQRLRLPENFDFVKGLGV